MDPTQRKQICQDLNLLSTAVQHALDLFIAKVQPIHFDEHGNPPRLIHPCDVYNLQGGWEGWFQVELVCLLHETVMKATAEHGWSVAITREQRVYGDSEKTDILIVLTDRKDKSIKRHMSVELKCQSKGNKDGIRTEIAKDIKKVWNFGIAKPYRPCRAMNIFANVEGDVKSYLKFDDKITAKFNKIAEIKDGRTTMDFYASNMDFY
ncbi:hypothetical protein GGR57DRAFT_184573 [Xylariaceae sp. FL1272]|nr:hypothetical protein GGR57DRAFT_184573 [Xylariaceae sp. FL1272]